jgi:hypothetical protein
MCSGGTARNPGYKEFMSGSGFILGAYKPSEAKPGPIPTLGKLAMSEPRWFWLTCPNSFYCTHKAAMPLAPLIIRWGAETSSGVLRQCAPSTRCGTKGARTLHRSVSGLTGSQR